jgi:hypothetical protein
MRPAKVLRTLFLSASASVGLFVLVLYMRSAAAVISPWQIWGELGVAVAVPFAWTIVNRRLSERLRAGDLKAWKRWGNLGDLIQTTTIASLAALSFADRLAGPHVLIGLCLGALTPRYIVRLHIRRFPIAGMWAKPSKATAG